MSVAGSPSWRHHGSCPRNPARRRRGHPLRRFAPLVSPLEKRHLLSGNLVGPEMLANTQVAGVQRLSTDGGRSIDVNDAGTVIAVWTTTDAHGSRVLAQRIGADGSPLGAEIPVSTTRGGIQGSAVVASNGQGQFVVAWESRGNPRDPSGSGVFARTFSSDGSPLSDEFRVNPTIPGNQGGPSIAWISSTRFVVTWSGAGMGRARTVWARVFDVSGQAVTNEARVPQGRFGGQRDAVVISLPDGGFQVAWNGRGPGGMSGIVSRQFNGDGKPLGPAFLVTTSKAAADRPPVMARDGNEVIIAWQAVGDALDRSGTGVVARRFALNGTPLGNTFLINQTTRGRQEDPSVAVLSDGGFVVAWQGRGATDADGIYAREFDADGTPRGGEQRVNTTVSGKQADPTVQALGAMNYAVAWDGNVVGDRRGVALAAVQAGIPMPDSNVGSLSDVFFVGDGNHPAPPVKTITFYNNTDRMVYPVLEDANAAKDPNVSGTSLYDPLDPFNNEYRGYVGYADDQGNVWLGLKPGQRIDVQVPLVFWNAGTIQILTSGDIFKNTPTYNYQAGDGSQRFLQDALGPDTSGRVLWYHAPIAQNFGADAPSQLAEYTFRDNDLATWAPNVSNSEKHTLINYDVSYVQDMMLPVAMEAANVPIPNTNATQTYGWIGANLTLAQMQEFLASFTADAGPGNFQPLLGRYFNGQGWDRYSLPNESVTGIKIPANDKTFGLSPFANVVSTYDSGKFMLDSGGNVLQVVGQGTTTKGSAVVTGLDPSVVGQLSAGMLVQPISNPPPVPLGTTIASIGADKTSITLSAPATAGQSLTFAFVGSTPPPGPIHDYVVTKLTDLWYEWANYYATKNGLPAVPYAPQNLPTLAFTSGVAQADAFAKVVYDVMTAFSAIPPVQGNYLGASGQLMQNILGCNVANIPNIQPERERELTIEVQSLLRGVPDHRTDKDWYPDPKVPTPGATENGNAVQYNVYNLDPFVWFVHEELKLSGYGFSVDDDTADVGANGATQLLVSIGGVAPPDKFPMNQAEWSGVAPWGPVTSPGSVTQGSDQLTGLDPVVVNQVNGPDPNLGVPGAIVSGPGIPDGTTIVPGNNNTVTLSQPATKDVSGGTYWFRGPNQKLPTN